MCDFCNDYESIMATKDGLGDGLKMTLAVSLNTYYYSVESDGSCRDRGRLTYSRRPANFCPECGRKLDA